MTTKTDQERGEMPGVKTAEATVTVTSYCEFPDCSPISTPGDGDELEVPLVGEKYLVNLVNARPCIGDYPELEWQIRGTSHGGTVDPDQTVVHTMESDPEYLELSFGPCWGMKNEEKAKERAKGKGEDPTDPTTPRVTIKLTKKGRL